jgi:hypothetical protein
MLASDPPPPALNSASIFPSNSAAAVSSPSTTLAEIISRSEMKKVVESFVKRFSDMKCTEAKMVMHSTG